MAAHQTSERSQKNQNDHLKKYGSAATAWEHIFVLTLNLKNIQNLRTPCGCFFYPPRKLTTLPTPQLHIFRSFLFLAAGNPGIFDQDTWCTEKIRFVFIRTVYTFVVMSRRAPPCPQVVRTNYSVSIFPQRVHANVRTIMSTNKTPPEELVNNGHFCYS